MPVSLYHIRSLGILIAFACVILGAKVSAADEVQRKFEAFLDLAHHSSLDAVTNFSLIIKDEACHFQFEFSFATRNEAQLRYWKKTYDLDLADVKDIGLRYGNKGLLVTTNRGSFIDVTEYFGDLRRPSASLLALPLVELPDPEFSRSAQERKAYLPLVARAYIEDQQDIILAFRDLLELCKK